MKWVDYRKKLGIGFSDTDKAKLLKNKIYTFLKYSELASNYSDQDYYRFCLYTGRIYTDPSDVQVTIANIFQKNEFTIAKSIAYYVAIVNTIDDDTKKQKYSNDIIAHKAKLIDQLKEFLVELRIQFDLIQDEDGFFIFPKGAPELDDALVSEPLEWLKDYPLAHKTYVTALKQYSDGIYIRDVADNLRKALEAFLQEFLGNEKNLETNKNEICKYLGEQGVDAGITGLFQPLINAYKSINDRIAKHNDAVDAKMLEFLLYQTGVLIRMVLTVKQSEPEVSNNAD